MAQSRRLLLQQALEEAVGPDVEVHFEPQNNMSLTYPCVVYELDSMNVTRADNRPYTLQDQYQVMLIVADPDVALELRHKIASMPMAIHRRRFKSGYLIHEVFNVYS